MALLFCVSVSFAQDYSDYSGRTINIQPLVPYTGLPTDNSARAINASQTTPIQQNYTQQGIAVNNAVNYDFQIQQLDARIRQLELLNTDAQNRIAALENSHNSLANQVANLSQGNTSTVNAPTQPTQPVNSGSSYLQVGAFSRIDLAGQLVYKLQQLGYQVFDSTSPTGVTKLFVGPFANQLLPEEQYKLSLQNIRDSFPIAVP